MTFANAFVTSVVKSVSLNHRGHEGLHSGHEGNTGEEESAAVSVKGHGGAEVEGVRTQVLVCPVALFVERPRQALEVCVEGDEARPLEEGSPARLVRDAVERALAEADGKLVPARQADRGRVERVDRDFAPLRLAHGALEVYGVNRGREVEAARSVQPVGDEEDGVAVLCVGGEHSDRVAQLDVRVVGRDGGRACGDAQGAAPPRGGGPWGGAPLERAGANICDHHARAFGERAYELTRLSSS